MAQQVHSFKLIAEFWQTGSFLCDVNVPLYGVEMVINKILIIDDEIIFCNALRHHLIQKGYGVEVCTSYQEFQNKIDLGQFEVLLLDLNLKDIKGLDLLQIIIGIKLDLKVIIISAYLDHSNILKAKELGACECIKKSSQMFHVLDRIIETL